MLATFTIKVPSTRDIQRMPVQLAGSIVGVAVKGATHQTKEVRLGQVREAATRKGDIKFATDIICATNTWAKNVEQPIYDGKSIFVP